MRVTDFTASDVARLRAQAKPLKSHKLATEAELNQTAESYESMFLSQMLEQMFSGVETNEMFGGGEGEDVYRSFMLDEYSKLIAHTGGIGIASHVKAEMLRLQEVQQPIQHAG